MKFKFWDCLFKTHFWHRIYGPTSWQTDTDLAGKQVKAISHKLKA